jgi:MoxR-like ATPase
MTMTAGAKAALTKLPLLVENIERVVHGKRGPVTLAIVGLLAEGHVLLEDAPGTGKTTLARALARSVDLAFRRVQFTSDLLPADVLGVAVHDRDKGEFVFKPGPIFGNVVLADELNRTSPRTQSALLEAMNERRVSVEGRTRDLPRPFLVIATQNPLEFEGTYPLPESQLDRFLLRIEMGYPDREAERRILLAQAHGDPLAELQPVMTRDELRAAIEAVKAVRVDPSLTDYVLDLVEATRTSSRFLLGLSPRAGIGLYRAAQALAAMENRDYCIPDDVKRLAVPSFGHRVVPRPVHGAESADGRRLIAELVEKVPVPS